jgi:hypothetical protein
VKTKQTEVVPIFFIWNDLDLVQPPDVKEVALEASPSDPAGGKGVAFNRIVTSIWSVMEDSACICKKGGLVELELGKGVLVGRWWRSTIQPTMTKAKTTMTMRAAAA